jgi:hypothetical protein
MFIIRTTLAYDFALLLFRSQSVPPEQKDAGGDKQLSPCNTEQGCHNADRQTCNHTSGHLGHSGSDSLPARDVVAEHQHACDHEQQDSDNLVEGLGSQSRRAACRGSARPSTRACTRSAWTHPLPCINLFGWGFDGYRFLDG